MVRGACIRVFMAAVVLAAPAAHASEIVRCRGAGGAVTYQHEPCPASTLQSRLRIASEYPAPNAAESQRIFQREAALDRRLEARRDRELVEQQMREARAEREAERERLALLAAQAAQPQYLLVYPAPVSRMYPRRSLGPGPLPHLRRPG